MHHPAAVWESMRPPVPPPFSPRLARRCRPPCTCLFIAIACHERKGGRPQCEQQSIPKTRWVSPARVQWEPCTPTMHSDLAHGPSNSVSLDFFCPTGPSVGMVDVPSMVLDGLLYQVVGQKKGGVNRTTPHDEYSGETHTRDRATQRRPGPPCVACDS